jgi:hypothetical protein
MLGAICANDFLRQANGYGQADSDHPSSRTDPDDAERLTGIYGSVSVVPGASGWTAARIGAGGLGDSLQIWPPMTCLHLTCPRAADPGLAHRAGLIRSLSASWRDPSQMCLPVIPPRPVPASAPTLEGD